MKAEINDNKQKLDIYKTPPYLVSSVVEVVVSQPAKENESDELPSAQIGLILKTTTRQTIFSPVVGLIDVEKLKPGDLIGVNKDTYIPMYILPTEFDLRAKSMILLSPEHEKNLEAKKIEEYNALETFTDIAGVDTQVEEIMEAVVLPLRHPDRFESLGVTPGKGALFYGPPGTGKTLVARAIAKELGASFMRINASSLAQSYVGSGAALVRNIFKLAREKAPSIIFIDEIDAIGATRQIDENQGSREITRTLLELLNQLDGFSKDSKIKVIAATNRADILDPALVRSGRLDRKIKFQLPDRKGREEILNIHSRKMKIDPANINLEEIADACTGLNGSQLRAVCVEAGMIAIRKGKDSINQNDFVEAIWEVKDKKKKKLPYFV
eukprot:GAHX01000199.1.p1 GENE.GAHX01000199.1~~GAHX01000199.1.p1  ORF type:complete len:443 (+),score=87.12 GAHX01000199.1:182-1330(+)